MTQSPVLQRPGLSPAALARVRFTWGALLLFVPGPLVRLLGGSDMPTSRAVARVLGGRQLLQALWQGRGGPDRQLVGAGIDATHALTGLGFGLIAPGWRRATGTDAVVAAGFGLASAWLWQSPRDQRAVR